MHCPVAAPPPAARALQRRRRRRRRRPAADTFDFKAGSGQVIPGFAQAVAGMRPGGRRRFVVPPELGYSAGAGPGQPGPIPPGWGERRALESHRREPLVFEVQVVKVR